MYDFEGTCNYIFAAICKDASSPTFSVQLRRGPGGDISRVIVELGASVVTVQQGAISIKDVGAVSLPYTSNGLQITPFGQSVRLVAKQLELELVVVWGPGAHLMSPQLPDGGSLMAAYDKSGYSHSETSLVALIYVSSQDKIVISQDEVVTNHGDTKWLPYKTGNITVFKQTSTHLQMATTFGLELVVQLQPVFQAYVTVGPQFRGQTRGLCGNFNGDTTDDFTTSMGVPEGTASLFVDSWRAGNCPAALERETDPCSMSQLNKVCAETHCAVLVNKGTVFERCHGVVNPKPFYRRCVYQACNYEETFPHICAALGDYAHTCASRGILLWGWRSSVDNCSCNCPEGTYLNHKAECVRKAQCPCLLDNHKLILAGQSTVVEGVIWCVPTKCEPGCVCAEGLYENASGQCVPPEECPCEYAGVSYPRGAELHTDCKACTCSRGKWTCQQSAHCSSTCTLYGEGHVVTFDGQRFVFEGSCEYILATDGCGTNDSQPTFKILTENVVCGKSGVTCSRAIRMFLGGLSIVLADRNYTVSGTDPQVHFRVRAGSLHLVLDVTIGSSYNLTLIWNKHMTVSIKISRASQDALCGLCGNYNGNMKDDFETRSKYVASGELEFVNSWKESPLCGDARLALDPCSLNAFRRAWAERKCSIINSQPFAACHSQVYRLPYYEACVRDTCGCDTGGDCECLCDAVAAYAKACLDKGVCVDWRAPDFCPIYCDFYNSHTRVGGGQYQHTPETNCTWHYQPCLCPQQLQSLPDTNIEGCYNCSQDEYFDQDKGTCVPCMLLPTTPPPPTTGDCAHTSLMSSTLGVTSIRSSPATNLTTKHPGTTGLLTTLFLTSSITAHRSSSSPTAGSSASSLLTSGPSFSSSEPSKPDTPMPAEVCRVRELEEEVTYQGCTANVTVTRCEGVCASSTSFNAYTNQVDTLCSCCHPLGSYEKQLVLPCPDPGAPGKQLVLTLQVFKRCVCGPWRCRDQGPAPLVRG
ncbi:Mucin-6 [Myotis brandtii]|uniref:Mucin-6 n=1 Tax=Myotis brandtii TaxID=109478 RepID=S7NZW8_MYOBR|nr:Mucin-6 [Myotis brandtii]